MTEDSNFFPEYVCSFEKSGFGFLLRAVFAICHFNEAILTRHRHGFLVPAWGCTITVVQFFQLCSKSLRFAESVGGGVGVDALSWSKTSSSTGQAANSLWLLPLSGVCCRLYNDFPPLNYSFAVISCHPLQLGTFLCQYISKSLLVPKLILVCSIQSEKNRKYE